MSGEQGIIPTVTTINSLDDFLQALDANPSWRDAVRARILGEELLQLPVKFDAFAQEQGKRLENVENLVLSQPNCWQDRDGAF